MDLLGLMTFVTRTESRPQNLGSDLTVLLCIAENGTLAAATIYNHLARYVQTSFVWIVEDDVIPPKNAAELLLQGFDQDTASVAGPYRSRYQDGYVAWTKRRNIIKEPDDGVQVVEGNGVGCVMLRG